MTKKAEDEAEINAIVALQRAHLIVKTAFGDLPGGVTATTVFDVYRQMPVNEDGTLDEEDLQAYQEDFDKSVAVAGIVFETEKPTAEMVLGILDLLFIDVDDDE